MLQFLTPDVQSDAQRSGTLLLDEATWGQLRDWAEAETGMDLAGTRFGRLQDAMRAIVSSQTTSADVKQALMRTDTRAQLLERLTGQLTIGESFFFRNEQHFLALREHVVPEIVRTNSQQRQIRIWTAGCAGGEEPYSLAIMLDMFLGPQAPWSISILGTDLNPGFLGRAREACYRAWSFRQTDVHRNANYFQREGDSYRLISRVRDWVRFSYLNLVKDVYPSPLNGTLGLDLILFRNVAIYLKPDITRAIIRRFHQALRPGGWLLLGETEVSSIPTEGFTAWRFERATLHQKTSDLMAQNASQPASARPVLADIGPIRDAAALNVPSLPDWVPLPVRRAKGPETGHFSGRAISGPGGPSRAQFTAWEQVEHCLALRDFSGADVIIDRIAARSDRTQVRLQHVRALMSMAEIARARKSLETSLREEPMSIESQLLNASFAEEAGELQVAEQACRKALYIDRNCPMAHFHLAMIQQQKGDSFGARRSLQITLELVQGKEPHKLVAYGDGVCYGRLREMISLLL